MGEEEREQCRRSCCPGEWGYRGEEGCVEGGGSIQMIRGIHLLSQEGVMHHAKDTPDGHYEKSSHQGGGIMLLKTKDIVLLTKAE